VLSTPSMAASNRATSLRDSTKPHPIDIRLLGSYAVMLVPDALSHLIEQPQMSRLLRRASRRVWRCWVYCS
jgi:hypothetical protein